jgi:hypothetical protein
MSAIDRTAPGRRERSPPPDPGRFRPCPRRGTRRRLRSPRCRSQPRSRTVKSRERTVRQRLAASRTCPSRRRLRLPNTGALAGTAPGGWRMACTIDPRHAQASTCPSTCRRRTRENKKNSRRTASRLRRLARPHSARSFRSRRRRTSSNIASGRHTMHPAGACLESRRAVGSPQYIGRRSGPGRRCHMTPGTVPSSSIRSRSSIRDTLPQ